MQLPFATVALCALVHLGFADAGSGDAAAGGRTGAIPEGVNPKGGQGFGIVMTPASCKMANQFGNVLRFIEKEADFYPELQVLEVDHVQNPKLQIFSSKKARDRSILRTDEITAENMAALLEESKNLKKNNPEKLLDRVIGNMEKEEIESLLLKHNVQKLPVAVPKDEL